MNTRFLIGKQFKTANGVIFTILDVQSYPKSKVGERYKRILNFKPGLLVAISFRGTLIPNITLEGGVARLTSVEVDGNSINTTTAISAVVGVKEAMVAYSIKELK